MDSTGGTPAYLVAAVLRSESFCTELLLLRVVPTARVGPPAFSTSTGKLRYVLTKMVGGLVAPPPEQEEEAVASSSQGVIFVLENAKLETAKVGKVCMLHSAHFLHSHGSLRHSSFLVSGVRTAKL